MQSRTSAMKYTIIQKDAAQIATMISKKPSANIYLNLVASNSFFEIGAGGLSQFKRDYQTDGMQIAGQEKLGIAKDIAINVVDANIDNLVKEKLAKLVGVENVEGIIEAHSQGPSALVSSVMGYIFPVPTDMFEEVTLSIKQSVDRISNIYLVPNQDPKKPANIYQEIYTEELNLLSETGEIIGAIPGPFKSTYQLIKNNEKWGYSLVSLETDSGYFFEAMHGKQFTREQIKEVFCNPEFVKARNDLKKIINDPNSKYDENINLDVLKRVLQNINEIFNEPKTKIEEKVNQLQNQLAELKTYQVNRNELISLTKDENYDVSSRAQGTNTLAALDAYSKTLKYPTQIAPSFVVASNSIKHPLANVGACLQEVKKFSKLPKGEVVAGAFLSLASVGLTIGFGLITAASFGLSSPITLPAMAASAGLAIAGASIAAGTLTFAAVITTIFGLFKSQLPQSQEEKRLVKELKELAEATPKVKNG